MELILVRHAEPVRIVDAEGPADPPLHDRGVVQARAVAEFLRHEPVTALWSSPMRRAQETAAAIGEAHGLEVVIDNDLAEFDREATSYIPVEEMRATKDARWLAMVEGDLSEFDVDPVGFREGIVAAMDRVIDANAGGTVVVVCHGGVINAYLGHVLKIDDPFFFEPKYASVHRVAASRRGHRTVISVNEGGHLRGLLA